MTSMTGNGDAQRGQRMPRSARRAQLLESAQSAFVELGYHAAAMDDIAERAGVSKPVLYQHFPGKLELYLALLDRHCESLVQLVRDALASTTDNKERVYSTVGAYFDFVAQDGAAFRLIFESDLTNESAVRMRLDNVGFASAEAVADVIAEDAGVDDESAMLLAVSLTGLAQTAARHWLAQGAALPQAQAAKIAGDLAWRGIGGFPMVGESGPGAAG
ncbi:TetR/AcrR family transcriptional regulator [Actinomycetota bacterium]